MGHFSPPGSGSTDPIESGSGSAALVYTFLLARTYGIYLLSVMTISVLNLRYHRSNATSFPESNYERPYGTIEDRVLLGRAALEPHATEDGLVKAVFFSFKHLDEILSLSFQPPLSSGGDRRRSGFPTRVLNSRVISAAVVPREEKGGGEAAPASPAAAQVVLRHLREDAGLAAPTCVIWDTIAAAWQEAGCRLIAARSRDTVCECHVIHGGSAMMHVGLLLEEMGEGGEGGLVTTVVQLPAFHVEIIVASVAAGILLICLLLLLKVSLKVE